LHLGHAYAALFAEHAARARDGAFLLRIEDIDGTRCRPEFDAAILRDLGWLGVVWDGPPRRQSEHLDDYRAALARLEAAGLLYPCFCTRRGIAAEIADTGSLESTVSAVTVCAERCSRAALPSTSVTREAMSCS